MSTFAELHRRGDPLFLPNAWDAASARALAGAGFAAVGTTSLGVAAVAGKPDATGATRAETVRLAELLAALPVPITVDVEGGFSDDPDDVAGLCVELAGFGIAGVNLEDARPDGSLTAADRHAGKVRAAKAAAPDLFLNARTDVFWQGSKDAAEAIDRAAAYVAAGADGIFVPGVIDVDTVAQLSAAIAAPLNVLYLPGGPTVAELAAAGVGRISTGSLLFRETLRNLVATARQAADGGVADDPDRPAYAGLALPSGHDANAR